MLDILNEFEDWSWKFDLAIIVRLIEPPAKVATYI